MDFYGAANALIAVAVQGLRSRKEVPEWATAALLVVSSFFIFWLGTDHADVLSKSFWREGTLFLAVSAGITHGISVGAKMTGVKALQTSANGSAAPTSNGG